MDSMHQMLTQTNRDYKWSLVYEARAKAYKLREYRMVSGDWLLLNQSDWETLASALNHIELTNELRLKEVRP